MMPSKIATNLAMADLNEEAEFACFVDSGDSFNRTAVVAEASAFRSLIFLEMRSKAIMKYRIKNVAIPKSSTIEKKTST